MKTKKCGLRLLSSAFCLRYKPALQRLRSRHSMQNFMPPSIRMLLPSAEMTNRRS